MYLSHLYNLGQPRLHITPEKLSPCLERHVRSQLSHIPKGNVVVTNAALVTVTFCFHNSVLSGFVLNETLNML